MPHTTLRPGLRFYPLPLSLAQQDLVLVLVVVFPVLGMCMGSVIRRLTHTHTQRAHVHKEHTYMRSHTHTLKADITSTYLLIFFSFFYHPPHPLGVSDSSTSDSSTRVSSSTLVIHNFHSLFLISLSTNMNQQKKPILNAL